MLDLPPFLLAGITGFISGLMLSIPVGPVNLTIMNEGARRGFSWAFMIGLGATVMEVIYCFIAFTGFASFFSKGYIKAAMELFSFVFMLFIGMKFLMAKSVEMPLRLGAKAEAIESRIEERLHLGPKKSLLLVNCHGRRFLVATAGETIASLIEVGMPDEQPAEQAARSRKGCAE